MKSDEKRFAEALKEMPPIEDGLTLGEMLKRCEAHIISLGPNPVVRGALSAGDLRHWYRNGAATLAAYLLRELGKDARILRMIQETIKGVYHSEDASGTDRIVKDWSGCVFIVLSDEYDGKRIAVHIEVLEG